MVWREVMIQLLVDVKIKGHVIVIGILKC